MKIKRLLIVLMAFSFTMCTNAQKQNDMKTGKKLVAYFSCTGTTKAAAEKLAPIVGADLFEIKPAESYSDADLDWTDKQSRSTIEMKDKNSRPAIANKVENMEQYDTVFIGFPVWWYVAPTIINTFIESYSFEGKTIIPFATSGGSGIENCEKELAKTYSKLTFAKGKLLNGRIDEKTVSDWVGKDK